MHAVGRWRPAILHDRLVVFAATLLHCHLLGQLGQGFIDRLASPEREGQSPLKLFHPISWMEREKFSKCGGDTDSSGRASGCRSGGGGGRAEAPQPEACPPHTSRLPLREGRRPPHACPSPSLNMAPGPWSRTDGPVVPGRGARGGTRRRGVQGRAQPPLSFVCVRVAFSRSAAAAAAA